jgi:hypothetical protein
MCRSTLVARLASIAAFASQDTPDQHAAYNNSVSFIVITIRASLKLTGVMLGNSCWPR